MRLENMTKEELLEAMDILLEWGSIDPENLPTERSEVTEEAEDFWLLTQKYRQPLIEYLYRD